MTIPPGRMYDIDLRSRLCAYLNTLGGVVKREVSIGRVRADIVRMSDQIEGYEIKGDTDPIHSYRFRLQVDAYSKVFDRCWLVLSGNGNKSKAALKVIPDWWGLLTLRDKPVILRMAFRNRNVSLGFLSEQLWKITMIKELRARGHKWSNGVPYKHHLVKIVARELSIEMIRAAVIRQWSNHKSDVRLKDLEGRT